MYGTDWNCATIIQLKYEKYFSNILDRIHTQWKERYPSLFSLGLNLFQDKIKNKNTVKYWWIILSKGSKKSNPFTRHFKIDSCQFFSSWDGFLLTVDNKTTVIGRSFIDTWSRECFELIVVFYYLNLFIFICNRIRRYIKYGNKLDFPFLFLFFCCFFINYTLESKHSYKKCLFCSRLHIFSFKICNCYSFNPALFLLSIFLYLCEKQVKNWGLYLPTASNSLLSWL